MVFYNEVLLQREADVAAQLFPDAGGAAVFCAHGEAPGPQPGTADSKLETVPTFIFFF